MALDKMIQANLLTVYNAKWTFSVNLIYINAINITSSLLIINGSNFDYFKALQSHNGKHVTCIAQHKGYSVQDLETGFNKKSELMDVSFKPVSSLSIF